jgi:GTPase SAR1 family protein
VGCRWSRFFLFLFFTFQDKLRSLWKHYFASTNAIIYVVDSNDRERVSESAEELHKMMSDDQLSNTVLLVLANKQDLPQALTGNEVKDKLKLAKLKQKWYLQPCCAKSGEGLTDGLDWLGKQL